MDKVTSKASVCVESLNLEDIVTLSFQAKGPVTSFYCPNPDMLEVTVYEKTIPSFDYSIFTPDYLDHLRSNGVNTYVIDMMHKAMETALKRGMALVVISEAMV